MADNPAIVNLRGMALPLVNGPGGHFTSKHGVDLAWGALLYALFCPIGARAMSREFGSDLFWSLFDPSDQAALTDLENSVRRVAQRHVPTVVIEKVLATKTATKRVALTVRFSLARNRQDTQERRVVIPLAEKGSNNG